MDKTTLSEMDVRKLREEMRQVPFGNSAFQIRHFTPGMEGPERRYRNCLLQISQKFNALEECEYRRERLEVDLEEIEYRIQNDEGLTAFDVARLRVDEKEKRSALEKEVKLIEDALIEIEVYRQELAALPKFTREEFEAAELPYWTDRLLGDARCQLLSTGCVETGTIHSLRAIGIVGVTLQEDGTLKVSRVATIKKEIEEGGGNGLLPAVDA